VRGREKTGGREGEGREGEGKGIQINNALSKNQN